MQQILFAVVPGLLYLREGARRAWRRIGVYALILVAAASVTAAVAVPLSVIGLHVNDLTSCAGELVFSSVVAPHIERPFQFILKFRRKRV